MQKKIQNIPLVMVLLMSLSHTGHSSTHPTFERSLAFISRKP